MTTAQAPATGVRQEKVDRLFDLYDHDDDGILTGQDFEITAQRVNDMLISAQDQSRQREVLESFRICWERIAAGANVDRDGRVPKSEFLAAMDNGFNSDAAFDASIGRLVRAVFPALDLDGDGALSYEEHTRFYLAVGVAAADSRQAFRHLDLNHDGKVTMDEVLASLKDFYRSSDPQAPGSWLLGDPDRRDTRG